MCMAYACACVFVYVGGDCLVCVGVCTLMITASVYMCGCIHAHMYMCFCLCVCVCVCVW